MAGLRVLVTGGLGYIGSHTVLPLLGLGCEVVIVDNLSNASPCVEGRLRALVDKEASDRLSVKKMDLLDKAALEELFKENSFDACIHFAGLKAVGESVSKPLEYYHNNITGTIYLLQTMRKHGCRKMIFSSSATVYGLPKSVPVTEDAPLSATNPYGSTKLFIEQIMKDECVADPEFSCILLRYFNPVGAHASGTIGEDPKGMPNNLMPFVQQVAVGRRSELQVFGGDYDTRDGTGVRDFIHVVDLAEGHIAALKFVLEEGRKPSSYVFNLGTGRGTSVLEMVSAFEKASGRKVPYKIVDRRPGDVPEVFASPDLAAKELQWKARFGIEDMCRDQWAWASKNPYGYEGSP